MRIFKIGVAFIVVMLVFFFFGPIGSSYANQNTIESIEVYVSIHEDGSADITEHRIEHIYDGTERYIVKEELGRSEINNFTVTEGNQTYEFIDDWDIDASREEKVFKNGIIATKNGYELAWGIGEYGRHEYTLEYTVTNFIKQLKDSQMLYWNFISEQTPPERIFVEIETIKPLTDEDESIWAFGYPGDVHFIEGNIIARSTESLLKDDRVIILVQFRDEIFTTGDMINENFESIQEEAFKGSDYMQEEQAGNGILSFIWSIFVTVFQFIIFIAVIVLIVVLGKKYSPQVKRRTFSRRYVEEYYRDYPYEGNFMDAYYIVYAMGLADFRTLLTALLLKWIKEDKIHVETSEKTGIFRNTKAKITILQDDVDLETNEGELFALLKKAAGKNNYLSDRDLSKWAERNHRTLTKWEKEVMNQSKQVLAREKHLDVVERKYFIFDFSSYSLSESGREIEKNVYKYVNYLNDFSLLNEHEAVNVKIWDEIMIWAAYMNLTDVVMKQFNRLYPNYVNETVYKEDTVRNTSAIATTTAKSRREAEQKARSSGSGGTASRGGGGGAYGGGGSGGTR